MMGKSEQGGKTLRRTHLTARARRITERPSRRWIAPLTSIALLLLVLTGLALGGLGGFHGSTPAPNASSG
ncbi:MAG: hypothetical protein ACREEC_06570, partial [Thermoplasmata archaeon]